MDHDVVTAISDMAAASSSREKALDHRRKVAVISVCIQLIVSLFGFGVAMKAYVTTTNIKAGAFWAHIVLLLACLFLFIGVCQHHQEKHWMIIGMVANVIGILMAFIGTLVDGAQAGHIAQTHFNSCEYSLETEEVTCHRTGPADNLNCGLMVHQNSCYCCYIFRENHCDHTGQSLSSQPNTFRGVESCDQVAVQYQILLWLSMTFNLIQFVIATVTVSLVGRYKGLLTLSLRPTALHQTIMGPSVISNRLENSPVMIINQQTVGYYPSVTQPPAYSEVVGIGPPPMPSSHFNNRLGLTPVDSPDRHDNIRNASYFQDVPPDYTDSDGSLQPSAVNRSHPVRGSQVTVGGAQPSVEISTHQQSFLHREMSLPPPYSP